MDRAPAILFDPEHFKIRWLGAPLGEEGRILVQAILMLGDMVATSTVDAYIEQAQDSSGTGKKAVTGKSITQLTQAGSDDNKQAIINLMEAELDVNNNFDHARLYVTIGAAACDLGAVVMGHSPKYGDASDNDLSSVDEIIA